MKIKVNFKRINSFINSSKLVLNDVFNGVEEGERVEFYATFEQSSKDGLKYLLTNISKERNEVFTSKAAHAWIDNNAQNMKQYHRYHLSGVLYRYFDRNVGVYKISFRNCIVIE